METAEFRKLISQLDTCIEEGKRAEESKAKREALEQHLALIKQQIQAVENRRSQIAKLNVAAPLDISQLLAKLDTERLAIERQLQMTPAEILKPKMSEQDRVLADELYQEIMGVPDDRLEPEERWLQYTVWSCRWRQIAERAGNDVVGSDGFLKMCYARIRERMDASPGGGFIEALDRTVFGDWPLRQREAEDRLAFLIQARTNQAMAELQAEQAIGIIAKYTETYHIHPVAENLRQLKHAVRMAAKMVHLREEIADCVVDLKAHMGDEFAYLWKLDAGEQDLPKSGRLTPAEIVGRLARRMFSKRLIGACHGPWDMIFKGFPEHHKGKAKDALEMLSKAGVLRKKTSGIGIRVSIEPKMMPVIELLIALKPSGFVAVDTWIANGGE